MFSTHTSAYIVSLQLFALEIIFYDTCKKIQKKIWTTTTMGTSSKENQEGQQGLQDPLLNIGHPIMRISWHPALERGMMGMHMHPFFLALTLCWMQVSMRNLQCLLTG
jgi:hypothetical protein